MAELTSPRETVAYGLAATELPRNEELRVLRDPKARTVAARKETS